MRLWIAVILLLFGCTGGQVLDTQEKPVTDADFTAASGVKYLSECAILAEHYNECLLGNPGTTWSQRNAGAVDGIAHTFGAIQGRCIPLIEEAQILEKAGTYSPQNQQALWDCYEDLLIQWEAMKMSFNHVSFEGGE